MGREGRGPPRRRSGRHGLSQFQCRLEHKRAEYRVIVTRVIALGDRIVTAIGPHAGLLIGELIVVMAINRFMAISVGMQYRHRHIAVPMAVKTLRHRPHVLGRDEHKQPNGDEAAHTQDITAVVGLDLPVPG